MGRELAARLAAEYGERFRRDRATDPKRSERVRTRRGDSRDAPVQRSAATRLAAHHGSRARARPARRARAVARGGQGHLERPRDRDALSSALHVDRGDRLDQGRRRVDRRGARSRGTAQASSPAPQPADNVLAGVDLDAYSGDHRAAALREAQRLAVAQSKSSTRRSSSPTATSWWTKRRTSRRWSCACSSAATSPDR